MKTGVAWIFWQVPNEDLLLPSKDNFVSLNWVTRDRWHGRGKRWKTQKPEKTKLWCPFSFPIEDEVFFSVKSSKIFAKLKISKFLCMQHIRYFSRWTARNFVPSTKFQASRWTGLLLYWKSCSHVSERVLIILGQGLMQPPRAYFSSKQRLKLDLDAWMPNFRP